MDKSINKRIFAFLFFAIIAIIIVIIFSSRTEEKTTATFCRTATLINDNLSNKNGDTYRYGFLENGSDDISDIVDAMEQLEDSAPDELQKDLETLRKIAERIEEDPTQAAAAGLSGINQEDNVQQYINENCELQ